MKNFLGADFLLCTKTAETLYHTYAESMPVVDYHSHVSPREIYEDKHFNNITEAWLAGDHYKWRLMRWAGVEEACITGDAPAREKFQQFARILPRAVGNPLYHWCHMELREYLGYTGLLGEDTAQEVWDLAMQKFAQAGMGVRGIIANSNIAFIGTTDDPADSLEWHGRLQKDKSFTAVVAPSFRPDKALQIEKSGWQDYISTLGNAAGMRIHSLEDLKAALLNRIDYFASFGCRASDHGLDSFPYKEIGETEAELIFEKALGGAPLTPAEADGFKTTMLLYLGGCYARQNWVMQVHYNCLRNPNTAMFQRLGPDMGFDSMNAVSCVNQIAAFLNRLYLTDALPRVVLYSLNPGDNEALSVIAGAFQGGGIPGKIQHGSAWWFNDTKTGIQAQMTSLANTGVLGDFIGMLTDSRSFLSYTRHVYFRRILCGLIGKWIENGEYPADMKLAGRLVQDICYHNAVRYFGLQDRL